MFEYDEKKSKANKTKHGIDFKSAVRLWNDPCRLEIPAQYINEERYILIAMLAGVCWSAIFTKRNNIIRIISVRKSRENEKALYHKF
jgi:uncharacterized DUF497 family protein